MDNFHLALAALLFLNVIGWLRTERKVRSLLADMASILTRIEALYEDMKKVAAGNLIQKS